MLFEFRVLPALPVLLKVFADFPGGAAGIWKMVQAMECYKYNIFGRDVLVEKTTSGWATFYQGAEGKRRNAGIFIPSEIKQAELTQYLSDLCHEWATERHPSVVRVGKGK